MDGSGRTARFVLVADGTVLGVSPPLQLALPWWPETHDAVAAARERFGIEPDERVHHGSDLAGMLRQAVVEEGRADAS